MKNFMHKLSLVTAFLLVAHLGMAQGPYMTVGIIGSATANGWTSSTPMTSVAGSGGHQWTIDIALTAAEVKFRADNDWAVNWGDPAFPAGTGTQNGANIPVPAGNYHVTFDDATGNYRFAPQGPTATQGANTLAAALQISPNPAHEAVRLAYDLPVAAMVSVSVKNTLGQTVRQLPAVQQGAGSQATLVSVRDLAAGIYLVQLQAGAQRQAVRLVVE